MDSPYQDFNKLNNNKLNNNKHTLDIKCSNFLTHYLIEALYIKYTILNR